MRKLRFVIILILFPQYLIWTLDIDILNIDYDDNNGLTLTIELTSNEEVLIPENALETMITTKTDAFNRPYPIFEANLLNSPRQDGRFVLIVSNEYLGVLKYFFRRQVHSILTGEIRYIVFKGKKTISIRLPYISHMNVESDEKAFAVDEIYFSYCYSNDFRLMNKTPFDFFYDDVVLENMLKQVSVTYRLICPVIIESKYD